MLIGYARVSTAEQNLQLQIDALQKAGCEKIYEDKMSGSKDDRPGLNQALENLRQGDTLIIWKLDRLGRSLKSLITLVSDLEDKEINFKSLTDSIDTSTPSGRFFFHVMGALAEMERELISERTRAGLEAAKKQGRFGGRKPKMTASKVNVAKNLLNAGMHPRDVANNLGINISSLYRHLPEAGKYSKN